MTPVGNHSARPDREESFDAPGRRVGGYFPPHSSSGVLCRLFFVWSRAETCGPHHATGGQGQRKGLGLHYKTFGNFRRWKYSDSEQICKSLPKIFLKRGSSIESWVKLGCKVLLDWNQHTCKLPCNDFIRLAF